MLGFPIGPVVCLMPPNAPHSPSLRALLLVSVSLGFTVPASGSGSVDPHAAIQAPAAVVAGATELLRARVGEQFFQECITPGEPPVWLENPVRLDSGEFRMVGAWSVEFRLAIPSKPHVQGQITVFVDSEGAPSEAFEISGIGRCSSHPTECEFPIDEARARTIARDEGMAEGIEPWEVRFFWRRGGPHLWTIQNTLHLERDGCSGGGNLLSINANTGEIHAKNLEWSRICCGR